MEGLNVRIFTVFIFFIIVVAVVKILYHKKHFRCHQTGNSKLKMFN